MSGLFFEPFSAGFFRNPVASHYVNPKPAPEGEFGVRRIDRAPRLHVSALIFESAGAYRGVLAPGRQEAAGE